MLGYPIHKYYYYYDVWSIYPTHGEYPASIVQSDVDVTVTVPVINGCILQ
jgi:hypothetical protein